MKPKLPPKTAVPQKYYHLFHFISLLASFFVFASGSLFGHFNVELTGVLLLFTFNVVFGLLNWRKRFLFLFFHLAFFTFLLTRPLISMLRGNEWWYFNTSSVHFALMAMYLSLLLLRMGECVGELTADKLQQKKQTLPTRLHPITDDPAFIKALRFFSFALFAVSMTFFLAVQLEKLIYMNGKNYEEYYVNFKSSLPGVIHSVSTLMAYSLRLYLATLPKKKIAFCVLGVYVLSAVPMLLIGARNNIVLNILFALIYYIFRDLIRLPNEPKWLGKTEKTAIVVAIPVALLGLGAFNYIRDKKDIEMSVLELGIDFFYKQGVSFDVLCRAYEALPKMVHKVYQNFTFGPFIDYFTRSGLGNTLFESVDLGTQNSELLATYGNQFSHSMSYIAHAEYLSGKGYGSSYILELFADWGYMGIFVGSLLFGSVLHFLVRFFEKKSIIAKTIALSAISNIFFCPRGQTTSWILYLVTPGFWFTVAVCYLAAFFFKKQYINNKGRTVTMFEQCGFLDILYALNKRKIVIAVVTVLCGALGFVGQLLTADEPLTNQISSVIYEKSVCYEMTDLNPDDTVDAQQYAKNLLAITRADFSAQNMLNNLLKTYSAKEIVEHLDLVGVKPEDLSAADLITCLRGSVLSSTTIINLYVDSDDEKFTEVLFAEYENSLVSYSGNIKDGEIKRIDGNTVAKSSTQDAKNALSFRLLGIIGAVLGFVGACGVTVLIAFFAPTLNRKTDFEYFHYPVLGEIKLGKDEK